MLLNNNPQSYSGYHRVDEALQKTRYYPEEFNGNNNYDGSVEQREKISAKNENVVVENPITTKNDKNCGLCGRRILSNGCATHGIYVHRECFACATCGTPLEKNNPPNTAAFIAQKFYCQVHAAQRQALFQQNVGGGKKDEWSNEKSTPKTHALISTNRPTQRDYMPKPIVNSAVVPPLLRNSETQNNNNNCSSRNIPFNNNTKINSHQEFVRNSQKFNNNNIQKGGINNNTTTQLPTCIASSKMKQALQSSEFIQDLRKNLNSNEKIEEEEKESFENLSQNFENFVGSLEPKLQQQQQSQQQQQQFNSSKNSFSGQEKTKKINNIASVKCELCNVGICGAYILSNERTWCPDHFTCANSACGRRLLDCGFVEAEKGKNYCEKCYESLIAPTCNKCGLPITTDCLSALQKQWHPNCFSCWHCRKPFKTLSYYVENNRAYCEEDWNNLFTTKCTECKLPIKNGSRWVEALGNAFHTDCFNCKTCNTNLTGTNFFARDSKPFCRKHA